MHVRRVVVCVSRGRWKVFRLHHRGKTSGSRVGMEPWWPFVCATHRWKRKRKKKNMQIERRRPVFLGSERGKETFGNRWILLSLSLFLLFVPFSPFIPPLPPFSFSFSLFSGHVTRRSVDLISIFQRHTSVSFSRSWIMDRHEKLLHTHPPRGPN